MGRTRAKVAISIDSGLLARVERLRAKTGESRSAVFGRALARLTAEETHASKVERYVRSYQDEPEAAAEVEAARRHARKILSAIPWDEP